MFTSFCSWVYGHPWMSDESSIALCDRQLWQPSKAYFTIQGKYHDSSAIVFKRIQVQGKYDYIKDWKGNNNNNNNNSKTITKTRLTTSSGVLFTCNLNDNKRFPEMKPMLRSSLHATAVYFFENATVFLSRGRKRDELARQQTSCLGFLFFTNFI